MERGWGEVIPNAALSNERAIILYKFYNFPLPIIS